MYKIFKYAINIYFRLCFGRETGKVNIPKENKSVCACDCPEQSYKNDGNDEQKANYPYLSFYLLTFIC